MVVGASACLKKKTLSHCYSCVARDSLYSNIPALINANYKVITGMHCNMNDGQVKKMILDNTYTDTLYFKHDTLKQEFWTMTCQIEDY